MKTQLLIIRQTKINTMNPIKFVISFGAIVASFALLAPSQQSGGIAERFKQLDRNRDGKLTPDELPGDNLFKMLDKNGDGIVMKEESTATLP